MVRRRPLLIAALVAFTPAAAHAQATPATALMESFHDLCNAAAERAPALAAAERAGWRPVPEARLAPFSSTFEDVAGLIGSDAAGMRFLIVGEQTRTIAGRSVRLRACGVGASTAEAAQVEAMAQEMAGVARSARPPDANTLLWAYAERGGRHIRLEEEQAARMRAAIADGTARFLVKQTRTSPRMPQGLTVLLLAVPAHASGRRA